MRHSGRDSEAGKRGKRIIAMRSAVANGGGGTLKHAIEIASAAHRGQVE